HRRSLRHPFGLPAPRQNPKTNTVVLTLSSEHRSAANARALAARSARLADAEAVRKCFVNTLGAAENAEVPTLTRAVTPTSLSLGEIAMETLKPAAQPQNLAQPSPWSAPQQTWQDSAPALRALVLPTRADRMRIAHLRDLADFKSEYQLDPTLATLEESKDDAGVVMALMRDEEAIATIRFIPSGQGLTLTERFWSDLVKDPAILGPNSWEVGRLVMAPEHRRADLLTPLLRL